MSGKERVDTALVSRGLFPSREKAQAAIMAGQVYLKERKILKPSESVTPEDELTVRRPAVEYVSRGALKLEKAVRVFQADFRDRVVMDIGASTGGFTDVSLRSGAKHVYSIDVGYGQLDWSLRNDSRVTVMERVNARYLKPEDFPERPEITVMDVSFISICLILPPAAEIMGPEGVFYTLVKPQFEAGREKIGRKGVVRDPETHEEVLEKIVGFAETMGWRVTGLDYSPITGPEGNIEFLAEIRPIRDGIAPPVAKEDIHALVEEAHRAMRRT
ncbi:MAG: TlyA family RNA methyltransferase [Clostridiales bacterium]|nr:TlyA family RNA methyltransferase [Clostridiales bacterium]